MKKVAIVNNKGGVGTTTTVFNLAHYFADKSFKTLAIDTDPQINLSTNFGVNLDKIGASLGDYLLNRASDFNPEKLKENLYFISAGSEAEIDMDDLKSQGPYYYQILDDFLEKISELFDVVILDTVPSFNAYTISAIYASNVYPVMVPGMNELLGLNSTIDFTRSLEKDISGIILMRKEKTNLSDQIEEHLKTEFKDYLLKNIIRKNVALSESIVTHQSIFEYSKDSNGAKDYKKLGEEIIKKEGIK